MITGLGNAFVQPNTATPGGSVPPFPLNALNNGLSVDPFSLLGVLGQSIGEPGDPAQLLDNREIPVNGFSFTMRDLANPIFVLDPTAGLFYAAMGDLGSVTNQGQIVITHNQTALIASSGTNYMAALFDTVNRSVNLGDIGSFGNFSTFNIDDTNNVFSMRNGGGNRLLLDIAAMFYGVGDLDTIANGTRLQIDDQFSDVQFQGNGRQSMRLDMLFDNYSMGDINGVNNGNVFLVDDNANIFSFTNTGANSSIRINGTIGFTGTVTPVTTITVKGGIVTNVA